MEQGKPLRRLIVNADDFGGSHSINEAVIQAHQRGILTSASLMVNGEAFSEAVELARANPRLGVGLHLTLCDGKATLQPADIPGLVDERGAFTDYPVRAGFRYFFLPGVREQLEKEIAAQFAKFAATGLTLDHVNGHLHFHLHPAVFSLLQKQFARWKVRAVRLTREPWQINLLRERGRWGYRLSHALIFTILSRRVRPALGRSGTAFAPNVFGLLQHGLVTEDYLLRLFQNLPSGDSEIYSHPSMDLFVHEFEALVSAKVIRAVREQGIELIRYQDLWPRC